MTLSRKQTANATRTRNQSVATLADRTASQQYQIY